APRVRRGPIEAGMTSGRRSSARRPFHGGDAVAQLKAGEELGIVSDATRFHGGEAVAQIRLAVEGANWQHESEAHPAGISHAALLSTQVKGTAAPAAVRL